MSTETLTLLSAAQAGDEGACRRLVEDNAGLIWSVCRRYFGRGVDPEDLYQLGCLGFVKAVRGFETAYGTQFSTYAVPKIAGEIRRFLRDDGPVKVSRSLRERGGVLRQAREGLREELGREPTLSELSQRTGLSAEDIAVSDTANAPVASLQAEIGEGLTVEETVGDGGMEESLVEHMALREAVHALPDRERQVVELRYFRSLTQDRTARILGVSQVQVSRIERRALEHLRQLLE